MPASQRPDLPAYQPRQADLPLALEGLKVVDFSRVLAGPFGTQILADLGADVIKVEDPRCGDSIRAIPPFVDGDSDESTFFISCNRNKRSIALDINTPEGREVALKLIAWADVLVENYTSRVMKKAGLDYESLKAQFPRLIYLSISGYGRTGPLADAAGLDPVIAAETGVMFMNGLPGQRPGISTVPWVDITAALNGQVAVLAALHARDRLGKGQHIDLSMYDSAISDLSYIGGRYLGTGQVPERYGLYRPELVPSGEYDCRDGRPVYVYCMTETHYRRMAVDVFGRPDLVTDYPTFPDRNVEAEKLQSIFRDLFRSDDAAVIGRKLKACGVPAGVLATLDEGLTSPSAFETGMVSQIPHPTLGSVFNVGSPFRKMSLTPAIDPSAAPILGEHSAQVLAEIGYAPAEVERLVQSGAIRRAADTGRNAPAFDGETPEPVIAVSGGLDVR
ncbi:CaiB/BaiF CoA transferase family protein [Novosphingobium kaempferiae]|uniref:CaiB/BaiF CoA transferase family protein n=1 Tax=Novosphingobium kaempferiae TaxID=2896849 RepID=UPI001E37E0AE|nr:CoA transferase [Novosphingobium kaempferiae]